MHFRNFWIDFYRTFSLSANEKWMTRHWYDNNGYKNGCYFLTTVLKKAQFVELLHAKGFVRGLRGERKKGTVCFYFALAFK